MSTDLIVVQKTQRLVVDPPSRSVAIVPAGNVTKEAMDLAVAAATLPLPKGWIAQAAPSADQTGIGATLTDVTNMSVTWTADATRRYKITVVATFTMASGTPPGTATIAIVNQSAAVVRRVAHTFRTATDSANAAVVAVESGLSGSQTRKVQAAISAGTLTISGASYPGWILVEDIGKV